MAKRRGQGAQPVREGKPQSASGPRQAGSRDASAAAAAASALPPIDPKDPAADDLLRARTAMGRGDLRAVRTWAAEALKVAAAQPARAEARRLQADARVDPVALLAVLLVFAVIACAAWFGIFHRHA